MCIFIAKFDCNSKHRIVLKAWVKLFLVKIALLAMLFGALLYHLTVY